MENKTRIVIAEDHEVMRKSLMLLLNGKNDYVVAGEAKDGFEAIACVRRLEPDVLILDFRMPRMDGLAVIQELSVQLPALKIIVLTMHDDPDLAITVLNAGAMGYCLKVAACNELPMAIETVLKGKIYASPEIHKRVLQGYHESRKKLKKKLLWDRLTHHEREVLKLVADGYGDKEIAEYLHISIKTVDEHRASLMHKLDLQNVSSLTAYAVSTGWVSK